MQPFVNLKKTLSKLGNNFIQVLVIVFLGLPVLVLMLVFPSLRQRLLSKKQNYDRLSATTNTRKKLLNNLQVRADFLTQVLQATGDSKGDAKIIYPLLQRNLDKLDDKLAHILQTWATNEFSKVETETAENIALIIGNFSNLIQQFPLGNKANNMKIAVTGYQTMLKVFTYESNPENWAAIQNNLGNAYYNRSSGKQAENLENAIAAFNLALEVQTKKDSPIDWAGTQNNLGNAYSDRIRGDRAQNLENAIAVYHLALEVFTKKDFPIDWAMTQNNLGEAYRNRIRGDRAQNLENAIAAFNLALEVHTRKDFPVNWAGTQNNLGAAYSYRIRGNRAQNLEKAIAAYHLALEIRTKKDFPIDWASTQNNLGSAYSHRISGEQAENLEKAIAAFNLALEVRTKRNFPINWAMSQNNLGTAYLYRIRSERAENLENAIAAFNLALEVQTKKDSPIDWAMSQNNLGNAYLYRIRGERAENLKKAIAAYNLALEIRTLEANPIDHLTTSRNLGHLHFNQSNWQLAISPYQKAISAVELIRSCSKDDDRRQEILEGSIVVYHNIIQCFVNLQQYDKAVEYAERSRSRMVVELMASKDLYPNAEIPPHLLEEYYRLQQLLSNLRRSTYDDSSKQLATTNSRLFRGDSGEVEKQRLAEIEEIEEKRQKVWREIRSSDPVLAGQLQVDPLSIEQMQALIKDKETAILNFYTTKNDTYIFIVRQQDIQLYTCTGQGIENLQKWIAENWLKLYVENKAEWRNNMGEFLQQLAQRLQLNQLITQHLTDIKELIIVPHLFLHQIPFAALPVDVSLTTAEEEIPPTPLGKGGYEDSVSLGKGGYLDTASPFQRGTGGGFYREFADTRLSIPTGKKTTPTTTKKAKTATNKPTYLSDKFRLRVVPSCQILSYCDNRNKSTDSPKMGIVENATGDLKGSKYECQNLAQMFQVPNNLHLKYKQATVNNYRQLAKQVQILHSSHHASADLINPLESKLHLFDGEVTLGDVFTWRLPELTDVFLSCCETNLTFSNQLNDDILTIAAGFLSAGAQSVVSTLWSVDDKSTAEFCQLYYQFRNQGETRPEALRKAQFELRKRENFQHPYYWAGFVSQGLH